MITPPQRFGSLLRDLRIAAGLTQEALAERARLSKRGLQDIERGVSTTPRRATVDLLATALGLSTQDRARLVAAAPPRPRSSARADPASLFTSAGDTPFVGRAQEMALLGRFLKGIHAPLGSPPLLLLAGEPGIGKTRLLQALARHAVAAGWSVLVGGCQRRGGQDPYAPLLDALVQHLSLQRPERLRSVVAGCGWLVRLLPELAAVLEPLSTAQLPPEQERRLIYAAVARLLANLAGRAGTLLILDDLQWAGPDALDLLVTLVRGAGTSLRVVGAYRDTESPSAEPLGLLLADLAQARLVQQIRLGPLPAEDASALLDTLLTDVPLTDRGAIADVPRRAGGVPFFLVSYAQALRDGSAEAVPWDLAQGVRRRVALLPEAGQAALGAAAVVGRRAPAALLLAVTGLPEEAVLGGLEAAFRARLLLEEGGGAYAFAHDVIREVVEADLGAARRTVLHRRVAEALDGAQAGASPEVLAYHFDHGGAPDKAAHYLERAGDHAWAQSARAAAEGHYRVALERLDGMGRVPEATRVREKLGEALTRLGRYEAALDVLWQAAETYRAAGDWEGLGRIAAAIAAAAALGGVYAGEMARLQALLEHLEHGAASSPPAALYLWRGILLIHTGRYGAALAALDRADELARVCDDGRTLVRAAKDRADILKRLGRLAEALRAYEDALSLGVIVGDQEILLSIHRDLFYVHTLRGEFGTGSRHIDQALALAEQLENPPSRAITLALRGWLAVLAGDVRRAHSYLDQAFVLHRAIGQSWYSPYMPIFWARLALAEGEWAPAAAALQEAISLAEGSDDLQARRWAATTMAEIEILEQRPDAAVTRLHSLLDRPGLEECDVTMFLPVLAWAQLELNNLAQAAAILDQAFARSRPDQMRLALVEALRVRALLALRQGDGDAARRSLEEGLGLARAMPCPYAEARLFRVQQATPAAVD